jgi:hypothetical protein
LLPALNTLEAKSLFEKRLAGGIFGAKQQCYAKSLKKNSENLRGK